MSATKDWIKAAADEGVSPETVTTLISQEFPMDFYVVDQPAQGSWQVEYSHCPPYFLETSPERGHYEYSPDVLVLVNQVFRRLPEHRRQSILAQLKRTNPTMAARLPLPFHEAFQGEHWFIAGIFKFVFSLAGLTAFGLGFYYAARLAWSLLRHTEWVASKVFDTTVFLLQNPVVNYARLGVLWLCIVGIMFCLVFKCRRSFLSRRESSNPR